MQSKKLATIALLLFVAASVIALAMKSMRPNTRSAASSNTTGAETATAAEYAPPTDGVVAYYFHGNTRCPTCQKIESYARQAIDSAFADQLRAGTIKWLVLNYEAPENEHFTKEFEIVAPTVVLVRMKDNKQEESANLMKVWELVDDKPAFQEFVQQQMKSILQD